MHVPPQMRFITHGSGGGPEILTVTEGPVPAPGPGEVLIEVHHAGVNRPDVLQRAGKYPPPAGASPVLGLEVAGRVAVCGAGVTRWKVGDEVCALTPGGGYAEWCVAHADHCLPVPRGLDLARAAALPENWFTVWTNLIERGRLRARETVLIHGGSSGIGYCAIQLARELLGCDVLTTVGSEAKAEFCRELGAARAILYRTEDFVAETLAHTDGRGVDVILDMVGGPYLARNVRLLAPEGRLVQIAFLQGSRVGEFDFLPVMMKRLTITGSTLRPQSVEAKAAIARALEADVWPRLGNGALRVVVHRVFPLAQAADAHRLMESGEHLGKIVLQVR